MALRLLEIVVPLDRRGELDELLGGVQVIDRWFGAPDDGRAVARVLVESGRSGDVTDRVAERFDRDEVFRLVSLPVESTLPRQQDTARAAANREELYTDVLEMCRPDRVFLLMVGLSSMLAAIGMLRDNVAVTIGAMVVAPLLGPNVALALATTLGDVSLARRALGASGIGVGVALAIAAAIGVTATVDPSVGEIATRTHPALADVALALAAGAAGALAVTSGVSAVLVGVMVAVALLPPTVAVGLMLGAAEWSYAWRAAMLLLTNIICVNLAGVIVFIVQGVRPRRWYEAARARRATWRALAMWAILLTLLVFALLVMPELPT